MEADRAFSEADALRAKRPDYKRAIGALEQQGYAMLFLSIYLWDEIRGEISPEGERNDR